MSTPAIPEILVAAAANAFVSLTVKATLAMLAALVILRLARGASASLRHLVAAATFGVLLLLPVAARLAPARVITVAPIAAAAPSWSAAGPGIATAARGGMAVAVRPAGHPRTADALDVVGLLYLLGVAGLVTSTLSGTWRLNRVRRQAEVSVAGTRLANETARREGMPGGIEVAVSSELAVPITSAGHTRSFSFPPRRSSGTSGTGRGPSATSWSTSREETGRRTSFPASPWPSTGPIRLPGCCGGACGWKPSAPVMTR